MFSIPKHRPSLPIWLGVLGIGCLIGVVGVGNVLLHGHAAVYNVGREVPWGILISTYVFLVVSTTGLCLISSLGHVFGVKKFEFIGKRAILLAILTLLCGFATIAMELNHPLRMALYAVISPNFTSGIWWMGALYGVYFALLCGEFYFLMRGHHLGAYALGMAGFVSAIAANSNLGAVFGMLVARPYYDGPFFPTFIILSSLVAGGAIISIIVYFAHKRSGIPMPQRYEEFMATLGKLQALFLTILVFLMVWKTILGIYGHPPQKYQATMALLSGPLAFNFWVFEVLIGLLIPVVLLYNRRTRTPFGVMWAGIFSTCGLFFMRYDMVVAGQLVPMREGSTRLANGLLQYVPSLTETAIVVGAISLCLLLYTLAEKLLPLAGEEH